MQKEPVNTGKASSPLEIIADRSSNATDHRGGMIRRLEEVVTKLTGDSPIEKNPSKEGPPSPNASFLNAMDCIISKDEIRNCELESLVSLLEEIV